MLNADWLLRKCLIILLVVMPDIEEMSKLHSCDTDEHVVLLLSIKKVTPEFDLPSVSICVHYSTYTYTWTSTNMAKYFMHNLISLKVNLFSLL